MMLTSLPRLAVLLIVGCTGALISACNFPIPGFQPTAALKVTSNPKATVWLDGREVGNTPYYDEQLKPGEYTLKLTTTSGEGTTWEALVRLNPAIVTTVARELAETYDKSSGYQLTLESETVGDATGSITVVTVPDGALVNVDGETKGFAPLALEKLVSGDHVLVISSPGYVEKSLQANVAAGHKLTASIQLARAMETMTPPSQETVQKRSSSSPSPQPAATSLDEDLELDSETPVTARPKASQSPSPSPRSLPTAKPSASPKATPIGQNLKPPYVEVLDTPTGWLNVRKEPATSAEILTKINPGERYQYLDKNETGWFQIELEEEKGWVSSKYVKLIK